MTKTIVFLSATYALAMAPNQPEGTKVLESMTGPELVELHNLVASNLDTNRVNRFSDLTTAQQRTWAMLELYDREEAASDAPTPPVKTPKPPKAEGEAPKRRGPRFVFAPADEVKPVRSGSNRAKALEILSRKGGATFSEVQKITGWNTKQCYEGIRLLHYYSGYGLRQSEGAFDEDTTRIEAYAKK